MDMTVLKWKTNISCHNTTRYCSTCRVFWDRVSEDVSFLLTTPLLSHCSILAVELGPDPEDFFLGTCSPPALKGVEFSNQAETVPEFPTLWIQERKALCFDCASTLPSLSSIDYIWKHRGLMSGAQCICAEQPPVQGIQVALPRVQHHVRIQCVYYQQTFLTTTLIYCAQFIWAVCLSLWSLLYIITLHQSGDYNLTFLSPWCSPSLPKSSPFFFRNFGSELSLFCQVKEDWSNVELARCKWFSA